MTDFTAYDEIFETPVGFIGIRRSGQTLTRLAFLGNQLQAKSGKPCSYDASSIGRALNDYFRNPDKLKIPETELEGTTFQRKVWKKLASIAPGTTMTYGELAHDLNTSPRAVGNACRSNPVPIFIPCHRVVARSGSGGFMGKTGGDAIRIKQWLLAHESRSEA